MGILEQLKGLTKEQQKKLLLHLEKKGQEYGVFPLSKEQSRMWFLYKVGEGAVCYQSGYEITIKGSFTEKAIESAFEKLINRHEILKTKFFEVYGVPFQEIQHSVSVPLKKEDFAWLPIEEREKKLEEYYYNEKRRRFSLSEEIPIRGFLIKYRPTEYRLGIMVHHIVHDGRSIGVMIKELANLLEVYSGLTTEEPNLPELQYMDYVMWQRKEERKGVWEKHLSYWKYQLEGIPEGICDLTDDKRELHMLDGENYSFCIDTKDMKKIRLLASQKKTTVFSILLSIFYLSIYRLSGTKKFAVSTPVLNRDKDEFQEMIGLFVNTIPLSIQMNEEQNVMTFLKVVTDLVIRGLANSHVPFEQIIADIKTETSNYSPYTQIMFAYQNAELLNVEENFQVPIKEGKISVQTLSKRFIQNIPFDLLCTAIQSSNHIEVIFTYHQHLFHNGKIEALSSVFQNILRQILRNPKCQIKDLTLLNEEEGKKLQVLITEQEQSWENYRNFLYQGVKLKKDISIYAKQGEEKLAILDSFGREIPPGWSGEIYIFDGDSWRKTGITGYWSIDGMIQINHKQEGFFYEIQKEICKHIKGIQCKIRGYADIIIIYYVSEKNINIDTLRAFFPDEIVNSIPIYGHRLNYIPLTKSGYTDWNLIDGVVGESIVSMHNAKQRLLEIPDVLSVNIINKNADENHDIYFTSSSQKERLYNNKLWTESRKRAHVKGRELSELPIFSLKEALDTTADLYPNHIIRVLEKNGVEETLTYDSLRSQAIQIGLYLRKLGIGSGDYIIIYSSNIKEFLLAFWAAIQLGGIPVPVGTAKFGGINKGDRTTDRLLNIWNTLERPFIFVGNEEEKVLRNHNINVNSHIVTIKDACLQGDSRLEEVNIDQKQTALLLLTSGSTGNPKGVALTHRNILKRCQADQKENNFHPNDISMNWMPMDHVGALVMSHIRDVFVGAEQIHVDTSYILQDPLRWLDLLDKYKVTLTWAPNFAYGLINEKRERVMQKNYNFSNLRFVLNGGEAINLNTCSQFLQLLEQKKLSVTAMVPSWGMTETSSGVTYCKEFVTGLKEVSVGRPVAGIEMRIVDNQRKVLQEREVGHLEVRGEMVTTKYFLMGEGYCNACDRDGWFRTGDLGVIDNGQLYIVGREKDTIVINGEKYLCEEIEQSLESVDGILPNYTVVSGWRTGEDDSEKIVVFYCKIETNSDEVITCNIREVLFRTFGLVVDRLIPLKESDFPRSSIGKVQREKLVKKYLSYNQEKKQIIGYRPTWIRSESPMINSKMDTSIILVFNSKSFSEQEIEKEFSPKGYRSFIYIYDASSREKKENTYFIRKEKKEDYEWLLQQLQLEAIQFEGILHLWTADNANRKEWNNDEKWELGFFSLIYLIKAIKKIRPSLLREEICFLLASKSSVKIKEVDNIIPEYSALVSFLRSMVCEMPEWKIHHVDLEEEDNMSYLDIKNIHIEFLAIGNEELVAYRNGHRYITFLEKVSFKNELNKPAIRQGGLYIVTGGLGGIGKHICHFLLKEYGVTLLILGRTDLSKVNNKEVDEKLRVLEKLQQEGDVYYRSVDISEEKKLMEQVKDIENRAGEIINGVFHLAGIGDLREHERDIERHLIPNVYEEDIKRMFVAKVHGTRSLFQLAKQRNNVPIWIFSSINALFGASAFSVYSTVNGYAAAEAYAQDMVPTQVIYWGLWKEIGMSAGANTDEMIAMGRERGYIPLDHVSGLKCFEHAIKHSNYKNIIFGVDGANIEISRKFRTGKFFSHSKWELKYSTYHNKMISKDKYEWNQNKDIVVQPIEEKNVDERNCGMRSENSIEIKLIQIWSDILQHKDFHVKQKFFEVGGSSIKLLQLVARINHEFSVDFQISELFQFNTIEELANRIRLWRKEEENPNPIIGKVF
ncbi:SDR family NAD(P)-dependent oxidoreductase [Bacillus cytotoxicus]